jgi:hypothetical protein
MVSRQGDSRDGHVPAHFHARGGKLCGWQGTHQDERDEIEGVGPNKKTMIEDESQ